MSSEIESDIITCEECNISYNMMMDCLTVIGLSIHDQNKIAVQTVLEL